MDIYPEFVDAVRKLIDKIINRDFENVLYGNGQPMSPVLRESVLLYSRPRTPGGETLTFRNIGEEDFDEEYMVLRAQPEPPLYLEEIIEDNGNKLPPLDRSQISNWEIDGLKIHANEHPDVYFRISIAISVSPEGIECDLIEIK